MANMAYITQVDECGEYKMNKYCWVIGETGEIDLCIKAKDLTEAREKLLLSFGHDITRLIQSRHTLHVETIVDTIEATPSATTTKRFPR